MGFGFTKSFSEEKIMFPFSKNFIAGLLQQVCQLCEEQPGRDAEASGEKSYSLQKSSTFFLELELTCLRMKRRRQKLLVFCIQLLFI